MGKTTTTYSHRPCISAWRQVETVNQSNQCVAPARFNQFSRDSGTGLSRMAVDLRFNYPGCVDLDARLTSLLFLAPLFLSRIAAPTLLRLCQLDHWSVTGSHADATDTSTGLSERQSSLLYGLRQFVRCTTTQVGYHYPNDQTYPLQPILLLQEQSLVSNPPIPVTAFYTSKVRNAHQTL